jgi:hypothetical protein
MTETRNEITTIKLSRTTHDALAGLGKKCESFDTIVKRLITEASKK